MLCNLLSTLASLNGFVRPVMSREAKLSQGKIQATQRPQDLDENESKRNDRNQSEKRRRDRFNGLIEELTVHLAGRCDTKKNKEKSSILKLTGDYFFEQEKLATEKAKNELFTNAKPAFVTDDELDFVYLESLNMLIFALDRTGKVVYISDNAHSTLGHLPDHLLQRNVLEFIHKEHHPIFQGMLTVLKDNTNMICPSDENIAQRFQPFWCQFRRGPYSQGGDFETVCCFGAILRNLSREKDENLNVSDCIIILARPLNSFPVEKILLKADGPQTKFSATLNMKAKYDYLDKRVASVLGFFPSELIGSSLYQFCHAEDLDDLVEYHEILLLTGRITTCYYRHLTKGQSWIWLRSSYHLSYSDWDSKPQAVTCLSWVVPYAEVCAQQTEVLTRDKENFTQIRNGISKGIDGDSNTNCSSNSPSTLPAAASPGLVSKIGEKIRSQRTATESLESTMRGPTPDKSVDWTTGSEETQSSSTSIVPYTSELNDCQSSDFKEYSQFLDSLNFPMVGLTSAQQSLHQFLQGKYLQIINAINKQTEVLNSIQKQIKIQGEIRDLMERLEKERSSKDVENECNTTKEMLKKFKEMRRVCSGSQAEKTTAESEAICSKRLQEIKVKSSSSVISDQSQHTISEVGEQGHSPMEVEQINSAQSQPDIFFNQEHWLQTQAQQARLEKEALAQQMLNSQYFPREQLLLCQQQQMRAHQLEQRQRDEELQQILQQQQQLQQLQLRLQLQEQQQQLQQPQNNVNLNGENRVLSQPINPLNTASPQNISTLTNETSFTNNLQQNSPGDYISVSPHSANESLYDYQWF